MTATLPPVHPGEILREEFLAPLGLSVDAVAEATRLPRSRIERLTREEADLTPDMALRLARYFGTSAEFWLNLQTAFALAKARDSLGEELNRIKPIRAST